MKTVNETFNGLREFPVAGHYFELLSTVNAVDVVLYGKGDVVLARLLQISQGVYHDRRSANLEPFQRVEVTTGANEAVKFFVGDGVTSNRSALTDVSDKAARLLGIVYGTLGQVRQLLIGGINALATYSRGGAFADWMTDDGVAFTGYISQAGVAAQNSYAQVKNPAASGKTVYVDRASCDCDSTIRPLLASLYNTDLTTDGGALVNKDAGGAAASSHVRSDTNAAALGTTIAQTTAPASLSGVFVFNPPVKLGAGEGLAIRCGSANVPLTVSFECREY